MDRHVNPWARITDSPPYVATIDKLEAAANEQKILSAGIQLDVLPEPYVGNPKTAEVYLLNLNPGFDVEDRTNLRDAYYVEKVHENLRQDDNATFMFFDEALSHTSGYKWAMRYFGNPLMREGVLLESIRRKIMSIEYMPYHSKDYRYGESAFPSQKYSVQLVKEAMSKGKIIVILRKKKEWLRIIPELETYGFFELNNKQQVYLSRKNFAINGPDAYDKVIEVLKEPNG